MRANISGERGLLLLRNIGLRAQNQNLNHSSYTTGYLLLGCVVFLAAFNIRKKITFLPIVGSAASWMQLHIYVGLATFAIFGFHLAWRLPNGLLESTLATVYLTVGLSGVYGLYMTRVYPSRITGLNDETTFECIPALRKKLSADARTLVLQVSETSDVLGKFYVNRLSRFLERPPRLAYLVYPTGHTRRQLISEIEDLDRYLSADQRAISRQLTGMVKQRDDLDYHYALQGRLKTWMFVHIGLTYSLLILGFAHMILVHAFAGGIS